MAPEIGQPLPFTAWPALVPPIVSRIVPWPDLRHRPSRALRISPRCDTRDLGNDGISDRGRPVLGDQLASADELETSIVGLYLLDRAKRDGDSR